MVWFQCEDCGENLKKPKLANHFRSCSAYKLSCIDCGEMFNQESVQSHTQCITEAEKYGPKGRETGAHNGQTKPDKPKKNSDVDINVGLSSRPPWFCSLCNTQATSKQTLLLHADGKKHRAKARAFHAAQKPSNQTDPTPNEEVVGTGQKTEPVEANGSNNKVQQCDLLYKESDVPSAGYEKEKHTRKRKADSSEEDLSKKSDKKNGCESTNGEVIQAGKSEESPHQSKKKKNGDQLLNCEDQADKQGHVVESFDDKIKWKKLITSTLKSSDGVMKARKLQKLVIKALKESGVTKNEDELRDQLMHKINSSSRFATEGKCIRLVPKTDES